MSRFVTGTVLAIILSVGIMFTYAACKPTDDPVPPAPEVVEVTPAEEVTTDVTTEETVEDVTPATDVVE